jgi:hypothetical protein
MAQRSRLHPAVALTVLALLAAPGAAHAATVRGYVAIQGAGTVSGAGGECSNGNQSSWYTKPWDAAPSCYFMRSNDPSFSGISMTLVATPSTWPPNNWQFVRWEGCESTDEANGTCTISAPWGEARNWSPKAYFYDPVAPALSSGPSDSYSSSAERTAIFSFGYNADAVATQCRIDGAAFATCSSGVSYGPLAEGDHSFDVRASDATGNVSAPANRTFKIVDTAITAGPSNGGLVNSRAATFRYSSGAAGSHFECRLDGAATFTSCPDEGIDYTGLADGQHTFRVRARAGGYYDHIEATRTWRVDATAPVAALGAHVLTPGEGVISTLTTAAFALAANEPGTFQCRLDAGEFEACTTPQTYSGLQPGPHQFSVRAIDLAGNVSAPVTRSWTIAVPDNDGDGYNQAADCDDGNAGVNPGRAEIVNNDVDENCDGVKAYDRDGDGSLAGADCDDANPARTPGKYDRPGNGIDENCDGRDALRSMSIQLAWNADPGQRFTVLRELALSGAPRGSKVRLVCKGRGCPRRALTLTTAKRRQPLPQLTGRRLRAGAVITVTASHPGYVTAVKRLRIRAGKAPLASLQLCLPPGRTKPGPC